TRNTHSRVRANALQLAAPGLTSEVDASVFDPEPHRSRDRRAVTPETDDQAVVRAVERVDRTERLALGDGTGLGMHGAPIEPVHRMNNGRLDAHLSYAPVRGPARPAAPRCPRSCVLRGCGPTAFG